MITIPALRNELNRYMLITHGAGEGYSGDPNDLLDFMEMYGVGSAEAKKLFKRYATKARPIDLQAPEERYYTYAMDDNTILVLGETYDLPDNYPHGKLRWIFKPRAMIIPRESKLKFKIKNFKSW